MAETRDPNRLRADGKAAVENSVYGMFARATGAPRFSCSSDAMLTPFMQQLQQQQADPISAPPTSPNQQAGLV